MILTTNQLPEQDRPLPLEEERVFAWVGRIHAHCLWDFSRQRTRHLMQGIHFQDHIYRAFCWYDEKRARECFHQYPEWLGWHPAWYVEREWDMDRVLREHLDGAEFWELDVHWHHVFRCVVGWPVRHIQTYEYVDPETLLLGVPFGT